MFKRLVWWQVALTTLIVGTVLGWFLRVWYVSHQPNPLVQIREDSSQYHFIRPLLLVDIPRESPEYAALKSQIEQFVHKATREGKAESISVYFRDLNFGRWTGVNETWLYGPSSMLKVAVMLWYLKAASTNPDILTEELYYKNKTDFGQHYPPSHVLADGRYTIKQLIEAMIVDSDNVALGLLFDQHKQALAEVFKGLKIPPPPTADTVDYMSPQVFSQIIRTLFSSTYLPRGLSEYALQLLSLTTFKHGLVAGVPADIVVAHKFGEHTSTDALGQVISRELHDCGVVYYPTRPYLLCVMTKGQDFGQLQQVIADISAIVYRGL
ncbi:MAG: serine hydrolase [Patescibacteria group bacterium]